MDKVTNPIKVLDLRDSPWVDGPGRTVLDCAEMMDPVRCQIVVGVFDGGKTGGTTYEHEARNRGLTVERITERRSADPNVLRQIVSIAREHKVDVLHTHDFRSDLYGIAAKRILKIPMVSTVHGWIENDLKGRISTMLDKFILRSIDHVIAVSDQTRRKLGPWATKDRCTVIPNALRVDQYQPNQETSLFRSSHGIGANEIVIANIGRLSPEKGQLQFLKAAHEILGRYSELRFVLLGIGPDQTQLEKFVFKNGMEDKVIFAGYRNDMTDLYSELDLVVQSSLTEGMPNVLLEALLMEVPVIATDVGGTPEVVTHGSTGVLIPHDNHIALVSAIEAFLKDRNTMKAWARNGRKDVRSRFDHNLRIESLQSVYAEVLEKGKRNV